MVLKSNGAVSLCVAPNYESHTLIIREFAVQFIWCHYIQCGSGTYIIVVHFEKWNYQEVALFQGPHPASCHLQYMLNIIEAMGRLKADQCKVCKLQRSGTAPLTFTLTSTWRHTGDSFSQAFPLRFCILQVIKKWRLLYIHSPRLLPQYI